MDSLQEVIKFFHNLPNKIPLKFLTDEFVEKYDNNFMILKNALENKIQNNVVLYSSEKLLGEKISMENKSNSTYGNCQSFGNFFGCFSKPKTEHKTDCYFFESVQDMGAHIPTCNYYNQLGHCPCENCKKYINKSDAFKMIKEYIDNQTTED